MKINTKTNLKRIQSLGSLFRGKRVEQLKKQQFAPSRRLLIPLSLSAEQAYEALVAHLGIGQKMEGNSNRNEIEKTKLIK